MQQELPNIISWTLTHALNISNSNYNIYSSLPSLATAPYSSVRSFDVEAEVAKTLIPHDQNARPKHFRNGFEECIFVFTVMMATSSTTFLQSVVVINTATIGRSLHMTAAEITWIGAAIGYFTPYFTRSNRSR
jgi:hypothetical protein